MSRQGAVEGNVQDVARYLGPVVSPSQTTSHELARRFSATHSAFYSLGGVWSLRIPRRWKRA
eukprot:8142092-Pyramimonas_sp.AAC.1